MKTSTLCNQNILATFRHHSPWLILMMVMLLTTGFARALGADMTSLIVDRLETGGEGLGLLILLLDEPFASLDAGRGKARISLAAPHQLPLIGDQGRCPSPTSWARKPAIFREKLSKAFNLFRKRGFFTN